MFSFVLGPAVINTHPVYIISARPSKQPLMVRAGEIAYHKEVEIFDDMLPFVDPSCMPDRDFRRYVALRGSIVHARSPGILRQGH
jgi:hypothetical protein